MIHIAFRLMTFTRKLSPWWRLESCQLFS